MLWGTKPTFPSLQCGIWPLNAPFVNSFQAAIRISASLPWIFWRPVPPSVQHLWTALVNYIPFREILNIPRTCMWPQMFSNEVISRCALQLFRCWWIYQRFFDMLAYDRVKEWKTDASSWSVNPEDFGDKSGENVWKGKWHENIWTEVLNLMASAHLHGTADASTGVWMSVWMGECDLQCKKSVDHLNTALHLGCDF